MKSKKWILIALLLLLLLAVPSYFFWISSPLYTVQEIALAIKDKKSATFYECVEVEKLIDIFTTELLYEPAVQTPNLSELQKYVCVGAVGMYKTKIDNSLRLQIDNWIGPHYSPTSQTRPSQVLKTVHLSEPIFQPNNQSALKNCLYINQPSDIRLVQNGGLWSDLAKAVGSSVKQEGEMQKQSFIRRMHEFSQMHPHYLISRLILSPGKSRRETVKSLLNEYGFVRENFRQRLQFREDNDGQVLDVYFFSPRVHKEVPISIQFVKDNPEDWLSHWKVTRLVDVKQTFLALGEDTDREVQELVTYSLQDVTSRNAWKSGGNILKRLGEGESTRKLWEKLKQKL